MRFKEKYTNTKDKDKDENKDKTVLSDDAFALGELLDTISIKLTNIRIK